MNQAAVEAKGGTSRTLAWLVIGLFFMWGGATSLNDILIPKLKGLYSLSYADVMLTQFAFFTAYFIVSVPAGALVARIGYLRGIVTGLVVSAIGALLFWPAAGSGMYASFLGALFVLAGGITILQVAANPFIALLGDEKTSSSRLTFAQAFNSLGTTVWPFVGSSLILSGAAATDPSTLSGTALDAFRASESAVIAHVYVAIAIVLLIIAGIFWARRNAVRDERPEAVGFMDSLSLLGNRRVLLGVIALFAYVGAEVSIGSTLVNYLQLPSTMGIDAETAGHRLSLYWGGAMVGRFVGAALLQRIEPGRLLAAFAALAGLLVLASMFTSGPIAGWALIAVGLFNSIMFPTIFSLSLKGLGAKTAEGSGLLCMAIVGGAILPLATGGLADATSIATALIIPLICYVFIGIFGMTAPAKD
ncbi:sugar MFS transporter [Sphingomonas abietis]|uniref:Sugar MFS transporter n=1 Tax=Sphingomonas abietis TaxID=3012344 RepID=A0ABY7NSE3_9SPHN|nr:sugar MFS transporter [Sphingomonas abietis]WBO24092.1 sugar MFS transporter [Sphingomonas abietis]